MSYSTSMDTITVEGVTYDVERSESYEYPTQTLTLSLDGEPVFEGLEARLGNEMYIEDYMNPRDCDGILGVMAIEYQGWNLGGFKWDTGIPDDFTVKCSRCDGDGDDPERFVLFAKRLYGFEKVAVGTESSMLSEQEIREDITIVEADDCIACQGEGERVVDPVTWAKEQFGARVVLPLYVYEHSGITISAGTFGQRNRYPFNCPWDTSFVGLVFDTAETRKECGWEGADDAAIEADIRAEIGVYASYLEGDVTYWAVQDEETGYYEGMGAYVGSSSECEADCFWHLEDALTKRIAEEAERSYWNTREVATV